MGKKKRVLSDAQMAGKVPPKAAKPITPEQIEKEAERLKPLARDEVADTERSIGKYKALPPNPTGETEATQD